MRIYPTIIKNALHCTDGQALKVEKYMCDGDMIDWSEASKRLISTIARAVNDKLLRDAAATMTPAKPKAPAQKPAKVAKIDTAPRAGTKIAHAMVIYKAMFEGDATPSRQDVISALAHSMQIEKKAAAGYYQSCKKKIS